MVVAGGVGQEVPLGGDALLLRWRAERGDDWMRGFVADWKRWQELRADFWIQAKAGNAGDPGDWR